jgi:death-on-curing protein
VSGKPPTWIWLDEATIRAVHDEQLAEHGGAASVRDSNLLASALSRPQQLANYRHADAADLAASYGFGLARNHPFIDGNKRTAFVAVELFLDLNGCALTASDAECVFKMLDLASGNIEEAAFADWIRSHLEPGSA